MRPRKCVHAPVACTCGCPSARARARGLGVGTGTGEKDGCLAREGNELADLSGLAGVLLSLSLSPPIGPLQWQRCWTQEAAPSMPTLRSSRAPTPAGQPPCLSSEAGEVMQQRNRKWRTRRIGKERKEQEPAPFDGRCQEGGSRRRQGAANPLMEWKAFLLAFALFAL